MKTKLLLIAFLISGIFINAQEIHKISKSGKRIKILNPSEATIQKVLESGIDLRCGAYHTHEELILDLTYDEITQLDKANIKYNIEIEDITKFYSERAKKNMPKAQALLKAEKLKNKTLNKTTISSKSSNSISSTVIDSYLQYYGEDEKDWTVPTNFNIPSTFGGCLKVSETEAELVAMRDAYPNLITVKADASPSNQITYGYDGSGGWTGQTVWYVKISDGISASTGIDVNDPNEPDILYTSMIHSRELSSLMGNIYFMWYLLENYSTDSAVKNLVDNNELFFVPIVNPDGLKWNELKNPNGGGMNRTNLRGYPTATSNSSYQENYGVDPNRNFDYLWGTAGDSSGSSGNYTWSTYRGPSAFSEPEAQIMRDFILARNFKTAVWQHSYANAIPHPYGGIPTKVSGREDEMARWHQDMTRYNRYISGAQVLTPANGIADDWMMGGTADGNGSIGSGMNILATTPENGADDSSEGGFWPDPSDIVPIAKRMVRINLMNAYYGGKYAKFHDLTQSDISSTTTNLDFAIERVGQTSSDFTITVTPISSNIVSVGSAVTETGMNVLEQRNVSIQLNLGTIADNDKIEYKVSLSNNDGVIYEANFEKYYKPIVLFEDDPDLTGLNNWTSSGTWTTVTSGAWSGTSIKDGSAIPYATSSTRTLTTSNSYNLSGATRTLIQFYAKWDLERNYDFVELLGSPDGGSTWYNLNGKYNKPNASSFTNSAHNNYFSNDKDVYYNFQNTNSSGLVYDGDQMDNWVMEEIAIDPSNNSELFEATNAMFRFRFVSDGNNRTEKYNTTYDGFYFDDFRIVQITEPCVLTVPTSLSASNEASTSATVSWDLIPSATYDLRYKEASSSTWIDISDLSVTNYNFSSLAPSTTYEVQVRTKCDTNNSNYTSSVNFTTLAVNYCSAESNNSYNFGITNVSFNSINNSDITKDSGYEDFSSISNNVQRGEQHTLSVSVSTYANSNYGSNYTLHAFAWIDFNRDGDFDDNNETYDLGQITNNSSGAITSITPIINIPNDAAFGSAKMRILAKYNSNPTSCETGFFGEVEDYTVNIIDNTVSVEDETLNQFTIYPNPSTSSKVNIKLPDTIREFDVKMTSILGKQVYFEEVNTVNRIHTIDTSNLNSGIYFMTIQTELGKATKKLIIQ